MEGADDKFGNAEADTAAHLGRRCQSEEVMDVRRTLSGVRSFWYLVMLQLHRFIIAISRVSVDRDGRGGTALTRSCGIRRVGLSNERLVFGLKLV